MKLLSRLLSICVFVLVSSMTVVLFLHVLTVMPHPLTTNANAASAKQEEKSLRILPLSPFAETLSKLSLFPFKARDRQIVSVMIENHNDARLHTNGLDKALFVGEFLVEGFISRYIALYSINDLPPVISPVRSLRPYFVDAIAPWSRIILHAGGSPEALERVENDPTIYNINGLSHPDHFLRDDDAPAPHNLYTTDELILDLLPDKMLQTEWPPYKTGSMHGGSDAKNIRVSFYNPLYDTSYSYNSVSRAYTRINGGVRDEAEPNNILIIEMLVLGEGEYGRLDINTSGGGKAMLFRTGKMIEGRWKKTGSDGAFEFFDNEGRPMILAKGQTWMTALPRMSRVTWE